MPVYLLSPDAVREIAATKGDTTNKQICDRAGIHETTLSFLLNGHRGPSLDVVMALAETYGTTVNQLLRRSRVS